jgi:hypothetical protein
MVAMLLVSIGLLGQVEFRLSLSLARVSAGAFGVGAALLRSRGWPRLPAACSSSRSSV